MVWPTLYGGDVLSTLSSTMSANGSALPPLPVLSVLLPGTGSASVAVTVTELSNGPGAPIVAVTVMGSFAPGARLGIVHGRAEQFVLLTVWMDRFDGVSATCTFVAVDGPALATTSVYVMVCP